MINVTGDSWLLLQVQILRANSAAGVLLEEIDAELAQVGSFWGLFRICECVQVVVLLVDFRCACARLMLV